MPETARITYIGDFMAKQTYHYDAFISYRHTETDKFVAENLHRQLEAFRLPKTVLKGNKNLKRKIDRVFRDQEELPLTDDLEQTLVDALKDSEWLIVICSPRYKESIMCKKEIETFIKFHGKQHILTVLVEGDPKESFPEQLLYRMEEKVLPDGSVEEVRVPLEPLAADVRGNSHKEILTKMKTEKLRLLAAMFGLPFDELRQRHREQRLKRIMTASVIAAAAGLCFGIYFMITAFHIQSQKEQIEVQAQEIMEQSSEIAAQNEALAYNQALLLADLSEQYMSAGDRESAKETAVMSLTEYQGVTMPVTAEGQMALLSSLRVYDIGEIYKMEYGIEVPGVIQNIGVSPDGDTLAVCDDAGTFLLYDLEKRETIQILEGIENEVELTSHYAFLGNRYLLYRIPDGEYMTKACVYDLKAREVVSEIEISGVSAIFGSQDEEWIVVRDYGRTFQIYDGKTFEPKGSLEKVEGTQIDGLMSISPDGIFTFGVWNLTDNKETKRRLYFADLKTAEILSYYEVTDTIIDDVKCMDGVAYIASTKWGEDASDYSDAYLTAVDIQTGNVLWENEYKGFQAKSVTLPGYEGGTDLLFLTKDTVVLCDLENGAATLTLPVISEVLDTSAYPDENTFRMWGENGEIFVVGTDSDSLINISHRMECMTSSNEDIIEADYGVVIYPEVGNSLVVYTTEIGPDIVETDIKHELPENVYANIDDGMDEIEIARSYELQNPELVRRILYSDDARTAFVFYTNKDMLVYDVENRTVINIVPDMPLLEWYVGKDEDGNTYLHGLKGCYALNSEMKLIMYIDNVCHIDIANRKVYLSWYEKHYEAPLYTIEELLQIAQEQ